MKKVILLLLLMPAMAIGQIVENFESSAIPNWVQSTAGHWKADTISPISGSYSLHHTFDNPDAGTDRIGFPVADLHPAAGLTRWTFLVRHGYDPSSSNNWSVFLMSDAAPSEMSADGGTNGFAIGVNLSGADDTLRLWKVKRTVLSTVVNTGINWQTGIGITDAVKIVVERTSDGIWTVSVFRLNGGFISSGSGNDGELFSPAWFGIFYRYSSTRDRLLWIDDISIEGNFYKDNESPAVSGCVVSGKKSVDLSLNEPPSEGFMIPENFSLNSGENKTVSVKKISGLIFRIEFFNTFINRSLNILIINNICDRSGNCAQNVQLSFTPLRADPGDVIISEIMADPLPEVSLPGKEYLELTNRTEYSFNLKNWKLSVEGQSSLFPETILKPLEKMIICSSHDTSLFIKYARVAGLKQFPSLTDDGRILCLSDSSGELIHGVEYSSGWYGDELKSAGGWSLEMIDTGFPFFYEGNWTASVSRKGGTPGAVNSVTANNPDILFSGIENVFATDSTSLLLTLSEPLLNFSGDIRNIRTGEIGITGINSTDPLFREFNVSLQSPLKKGKVYRLEISELIKDFAGNFIQNRGFDFGLTESPEPGDILFNELLFNPLPGDPDYLELFNRSGKVIDASRLQLVSASGDNGEFSQLSQLSDEKRCIIPGSYYAVTTDRRKVSERYFSSDEKHLFEVASLPAMSDNEGHLILFNRELERIDEVFYNEKMHFSLLSSYEGVALEKTGPDNKSSEAANWHSASESSGWGTPGAPNSVFAELPVTSDNVIFSSVRITPDNDGNEDFLSISLSLPGNGNVVSVMIFDETGSYVRKIVSNMLVGPETTLVWDGTADDGALVKSGIYIVLITLFDEKGKTERWKKVCAVIR
jgi:hypothetical protein